MPVVEANVICPKENICIHPPIAFDHNFSVSSVLPAYSGKMFDILSYTILMFL